MTRTKDKDQNAVAVLEEDEALLKEMEARAGQGVSDRPEDNIIPLIYVLDSKSPQCDERGDQYVPGAKAGSIWLRNHGVVDGQEGIVFQPCHRWTDWVEWIPRERGGGGFVARHADMPHDATQVPRPDAPNRTRLMRPNGNEVRETGNVAGFVLTDQGALPFMIPFTSTGLTVFKQWNSDSKKFKLKDGRSEPAAARKWRLTTRQRVNSYGKWYVFDVKPEGKVTVEQWRAGTQLYDAFIAGEKQAEQLQHHDDDTDDTM